eukprot:1018782-Pyramimonas_sp.AAC.1
MRACCECCILASNPGVDNSAFESAEPEHGVAPGGVRVVGVLGDRVPAGVLGERVVAGHCVRDREASPAGARGPPSESSSSSSSM